MNASSAKNNVLLLFKGEKNLFFRCGQDHLLSITSDFNLCPKRRGGGGPGGRVPLLGCSGVQDDYNCPPPVYTIMALQGKGCRSMYPPLGALGGIIQSLFTICLET